MQPIRLLTTTATTLLALSLLLATPAIAAEDDINPTPDNATGGGTAPNEDAPKDDADGDDANGGQQGVHFDAATNADGVTVAIGSRFGDEELVEDRKPLPTWMLACTWRERTKLEHFSWVSAMDAAGAALDIENPDEEWIVVFCPPNAPDDPITNISLRWTGVLEAWPATDTPPQAIGTYLVYRALASVNAPAELGESSPPGDARIPMITQMDTWLWLDDAHRTPLSATASILNGTYSATATITPVEATFTGGQVGGYEETVTCALDQMVEYNLYVAEERQHTDCKILYRHRTGDHHHLTTTVRYRVTYGCSSICGNGTLDDLLITRTRPVIVNEILVRNTAGS